MATNTERAVVATFPDRRSADAAIAALHAAGHRHTWLGVTETVDPKSFGGAGGTVGAGGERVHEVHTGMGRWIHRERDLTLYDALREHGVEEEDARAIDGSVLEGSAVVIVENADPKAVDRLVREAGGEVRGAVVERDIVPRARPGAVGEDVFVSRVRHRRTLGPGPY